MTGARPERSTRVVRILLGIGAAIGASIAPAQPVTPEAGVAPFEDSIAQRMRACMPCHGEKGGGLAGSAFPRLAGQPADYLSAQMRAFRDGIRTYAPMNFLMSRQSDAYFAEIATYFSAQQPDPRVVDARRAMPFDRNVVDVGKQLTVEGRVAVELPACVACHGDKLSGMLPATPAIAGLPRDFMIEQLGSWKNGTHRSPAPNCMARVASLMSGSDIIAAATWLSLQQPAGPASPAEKLPLECGKH